MSRVLSHVISLFDERRLVVMVLLIRSEMGGKALFSEMEFVLLLNVSLLMISIAFYCEGDVNQGRTQKGFAR